MMTSQADRTFHVYYTYVPEIDKNKYVVAVIPHFSQWYCFLINSNIPDPLHWPNLETCFFMVPRAEHKFLDYDSYLTTDRAFPLPTDSLDCHKGNLSSSCQQRLYDATHRCKKLRVKTKKAVIKHLDARSSESRVDNSLTYLCLD